MAKSKKLKPRAKQGKKSWQKRNEARGPKQEQAAAEKKLIADAAEAVEKVGADELEGGVQP